MAPTWRPASAASPYRHAVSPARSRGKSIDGTDPYHLPTGAVRTSVTSITSNDAYGDYHEIEKIMQRERTEYERTKAQKAELKEAERRAFVAERRAESAERAAAEREAEAEAEVAVAEEVATQAVVANRDATRALEAARAEVEGYRRTLSRWAHRQHHRSAPGRCTSPRTRRPHRRTHTSLSLTRTTTNSSMDYHR
jgi:hypothetical protein